MLILLSNLLHLTYLLKLIGIFHKHLLNSVPRYLVHNTSINLLRFYQYLQIDCFDNNLLFNEEIYLKCLKWIQISFHAIQNYAPYHKEY